MFEFKKKDLTLVDQNNFKEILLVLFELLKRTQNNAQAEFVEKLTKLINENDFTLFIKQINGVEMWGGSGAVWEVYIENKIDAREFEKQMLALIYLMEKTKIIGKGIEPIKVLFEKNFS